MRKFNIKFGQSIADALRHEGIFQFTSLNAGFYAYQAPYDLERLTPEGSRFLAWQRGRDQYPRPIPMADRVSAHPDENVRRAYAGSDPTHEIVPQPHIDFVSDALDATDFINRIAIASGRFGEA